MTNFEVYKDKLESIEFTVDEYGHLTACNINTCKNCRFYNTNCAVERINWLKSEYVEPEVDWSEVTVDTPIMVNPDGDRWICRHFAYIKNGKPYVWNGGRTSHTADSIDDAVTFLYMRLMKEEDAEHGIY